MWVRATPSAPKTAMLTGIGVGLMFGCAVFALVMFRGDLLAGVFSTDAEVVQKGFEYLKGFAPETIVTAILFSMVGYFNGNNKTLWVMIQGLVQTLSGAFADGIFHEHSAERQPDQDRPCRPGIHDGRNRTECGIFRISGAQEM